MEKKSICLVIILKGHLLTFDICKRAINKLICVELKKGNYILLSIFTLLYKRTINFIKNYQVI